MYMRTMLQSARLLVTPQIRPYRCDSPYEKRFMEMVLTPSNNGCVELTHRLVRSEAKKTSLMFSSDIGPTAIKPVRCSWCNRLKFDRQWLEESAAINQGYLFDNNQPIAVIYSICPACRKSGPPINHHRHAH